MTYLVPCLLALSSLGCERAETGGTLERARREGKLRLGFANEAPFAYRDPSTGRLTGEAPEVLQKLAIALGVREVEGVLTEFGSLIPGLAARRFDVIAAGMYVTPERCQRVLFSEPSYCVREALMVARGNPRDLRSYAAVAQSDAKLGVVAGTVELGYAQAAGIPEERLRVFPDAPSAVEGLQSDRIQAFAATSLTISDLLQKSGDAAVEAAEPFDASHDGGKLPPGCGAFAFRRDDEKLRDAFDRELARFRGSEAHLALVAPFGFGPATRVGGMTRRALCDGTPG
jgi:polar amino acid transport system substrate-binding protein